MKGFYILSPLLSALFMIDNSNHSFLLGRDLHSIRVGSKIDNRLSKLFSSYKYSTLKPDFSLLITT